jgi:proteasome component ECM29
MSVPSPPLSEQELQTKAAAELSSLGRVSHKLAMTDAGDPLERVLNLLLPRLLTRIGPNHTLEQQTTDRALKDTLNKIHDKLVEMMSHIMKRVRADQQCKLPCLAVLNLLHQDNKATDVDPFTINLTLAFLNLGLPRCTLEEAESLLPGLLVLVGNHSGLQSQTTPARKAQSHQVSHLLLRVVERMVQEERQSLQTVMAPSASTLSGAKIQEPSTTSTADGNIKDEARRLCRDDETIASAVYDLFLDVILYQPSPSKTMPPPGLSQAGHERLISGMSQKATDWAAEMAPQSHLKEFKLAMLSFIVPSRKWALFMNTTNKGISRTVALLVGAMGDAHPHVAEQANLALKAHLDSMRERNETTQAIAALGDPMALSCSLLSLIIGDSNTQSALSQIPAEKEQLTLGRTVPVDAQRPQLVLSLKRRMASEETAAAVMSFISQKVLDDNPQLLDAVGPVMTRALSTLAVFSASKLLLSTTGTSTLSTLRASPYIAAAQLLNALSLRLVTLDDPPVDLLAKSLSIVSLVLAQASTTSRPAAPAGTFEGSIAMRHACYGVVCALSRSSHGESFIFSCGTTTMGVSIDTATLLFACAANEDETLRPRAVAALDALLGAYCRVYVVPILRETEPSTAMDIIDGESNPWSQAPTVSDAKLQVAGGGDVAARNSDGLARALLPLLWSAAQSSQPKASRVAASRWSSDLLKTLDLPSTCHILCFLAGDPDVTAASIAREGLGLDKRIGEPYDEQDHSNYTLPDFSDLTMVLFPKSDMDMGRSTSSWRPRYFDFFYHGKAAALRFGLACLLSDLYGGEDDAVAAYVNALSETLADFGTAGHGRGLAHGRESIDLLDECTICLAGCLSTSRFARAIILGGQSSFGLPDMEALALSADSSKARRYLAEACGHIYEDAYLWQSAPDVNVELEEWVQKCQILRPLHECARKLTAMQNESFLVGEVHGAAFLGARCSRAFRLLASKKGSSAGSSIDTCWESVNTIIAALGHGTAHSDEIISNAFAQGLSIALSYDGVDAPILDPRIYAGTTRTLTQLDLALRKYGNGDHTDSTRTSVLAHAAGIVLAASTSAAGYLSTDSRDSSANRSVGPARIQCVDALFSLIGSMAFRKDPEVALVAGEALAAYADAYSPNSAVWSSLATDWPDLYSDEYAYELPPHQQVSRVRLYWLVVHVFVLLLIVACNVCCFCFIQQVPYVLLEREMKSSSPHKRTACAPALLALVGRASKLVRPKCQMTRSFRYLALIICSPDRPTVMRN